MHQKAKEDGIFGAFGIVESALMPTPKYFNEKTRREIEVKFNYLYFCEPYREQHYHITKPHHRQKHVIECKRGRRKKLFTEYCEY